MLDKIAEENKEKLWKRIGKAIKGAPGKAWRGMRAAPGAIGRGAKAGYGVVRHPFQAGQRLGRRKARKQTDQFGTGYYGGARRKIKERERRGFARAGYGKGVGKPVRKRDVVSGLSKAYGGRAAGGVVGGVAGERAGHLAHKAISKLSGRELKALRAVLRAGGAIGGAYAGAKYEPHAEAGIRGGLGYTGSKIKGGYRRAKGLFSGKKKKNK